MHSLASLSGSAEKGMEHSGMHFKGCGGGFDSLEWSYNMGEDLADRQRSSLSGGGPLATHAVSSQHARFCDDNSI